MNNRLPDYNYILASKSPRRQQLLRLLDIDFVVKTKDVEEEYPPTLSKNEVPVYLAGLKSKAFQQELKAHDLLITADTIVCFEDKILGKPADYQDAYHMLQRLSGKMHQVITGVCLSSAARTVAFHSLTHVEFNLLYPDEIEYYLEKYAPFDKAGAYGIQEWIGAIGIKRIEGSFYNVMGLPVQKLYDKLRAF